jgi:hypothetical protein
MFTKTFAFAIDSSRELHAPGAPFFVSAAILLVALGVAIAATRPESSRETKAISHADLQ